VVVRVSSISCSDACFFNNGSAPWHSVAFLDYTVERLFLHKVGRAYSFIHPLLQDYFAVRCTESSDVVNQQDSVSG
jgi:hypothetical protein